jgi:hypothetical protein
MNDKRDFDRAVDRLLDDGSDTTPSHVIDAVLLAVRSTPQERHFRNLWRTQSMTMYLRVAAVIAIVAVAGAAALYAFGSGPNVGSGPTPTTQPTLTPPPTAVPPLLGPDPVSDERMTVIRQQVDAINASDANAFIDTFLPEGVFAPGGDFLEGLVRFGNSQPVADADLVEAWMAINRAWGFEAAIIACNQDPGARIAYGYGEGQGDPMVVNCEVATRWHSLSMEITERWSYEFHGSGLGHWGFQLLDLNPPDRALPLGYDGLEAWEAWLAATHPASAARYLNPRISEPPDYAREWWEAQAPGDPERAARLAPLLFSAENEWSIQGHEYAPFGLIPYDPAFADEIEASIQDYLVEVQL